jgi:hypothetical protein
MAVAMLLIVLAWLVLGVSVSLVLASMTFDRRGGR